MADLSDDIDELVELLQLRKQDGSLLPRRKFERLKMLLLRHADDLVESAVSVRELDAMLSEPLAANWIRELDAAHEADGDDNEAWRSKAVLASAERHGLFIGLHLDRDGSGRGSFAFAPTPPAVRSWWDADGCATEKHPANRSPRDWSERIKAAFPKAASAPAPSFTLIPIELPPLPPCWSYPWTMPFRESVIDWRTGELRSRK